MAEGAQRVLGADVAIAVTGVAGPDEQDGQPVGTVWYGIAIPGHETEAITARLPFDRERIRQFSTITLLNLLRMRLLALRVSALRRAFLAVVPPPDVVRWTESVAELRSRRRRTTVCGGPDPSSATSPCSSSARSTTSTRSPNRSPNRSDGCHRSPSRSAVRARSRRPARRRCCGSASRPAPASSPRSAGARRHRRPSLPAAPHARTRQRAARRARARRATGERSRGTAVDRRPGRAVRQRHSRRWRGAHGPAPSSRCSGSGQGEESGEEREAFLGLPMGGDDLVEATRHADVLARPHHDVVPALPHADERDVGDDVRFDDGK